MTVNRYKIWIEAVGEAPEIAVTWRGQPEPGIARAKKEAEQLGIDCLRIWAEYLDDRIYPDKT